MWDYLDGDDSSATWFQLVMKHLHTVHANIMWQPVKQMRMGWEVAYLWAGDTGITALKDEYLQVQWGTWFFF